MHGKTCGINSPWYLTQQQCLKTKSIKTAPHKYLLKSMFSNLQFFLPTEKFKDTLSHYKWVLFHCIIKVVFLLTELFHQSVYVLTRQRATRYSVFKRLKGIGQAPLSSLVPFTLGHHLHVRSLIKRPAHLGQNYGTNENQNPKTLKLHLWPVPAFNPKIKNCNMWAQGLLYHSSKTVEWHSNRD